MSTLLPIAIILFFFPQILPPLHLEYSEGTAVGTIASALYILVILVCIPFGERFIALSLISLPCLILVTYVGVASPYSQSYIMTAMSLLASLWPGRILKSLAEDYLYELGVNYGLRLRIRLIFSKKSLLMALLLASSASFLFSSGLDPVSAALLGWIIHWSRP